ncbi:hypothetical protein [Lentzea sp. NEAU-D7]|uniref:hypothetical protein n=1 Tax=Lentzea sp. NEAU-D7 TaxID=2994667 RepID=UPI00224A5E54|nr:hypothetical protein [Lentzea sp. NEAU-D7]MCX2947899.1 hypothetical protein [Lentzea sp. NEAU-D7]
MALTAGFLAGGVQPQANAGAFESDASVWLMQQMRAMQPGTLNGGIYTNKEGYHNTRAANAPNDYSVVDAEDKGGPSNLAAAYDWTFEDAQNGSFGTIARYSNRLLASGKDPNDPRLDGWREFFGQTDNDREVEGWDFRYDRAASSDKTHLWHIHLSEDRDKVTSYDNKVALLSVLKGETVNQWRSTQLFTTTSTGGLVHTMRGRDGSWTGFADVKSATGAVLTPVDTASAMVAGEQHALVAGNDGELWHAIRRVDGPWTPFGNVEDFAGEIGAITRVAATEVGGALHVVVLSGENTIHHSIRSPNGSWTALHSVEPFAGDLSGYVDVAAAGFLNGELQVAVSMSTGGLLHTLRRTDGNWSPWGDVEAFAGNPGAAQSVSATEVNGVFHLVANYGFAGVRHSTRLPNGNWTPLLKIDDYTGNKTGFVLDVATTGFTSGELHVVALAAGGSIWHAARYANGGWSAWGDVRAYAGNPGLATRVGIAAGWRS